MKKELIMTVSYIFKDGEKGKRIVGGAESNYSTKDLSWLDFTDKKVVIETVKGDLFFKVKKLMFSIHSRCYKYWIDTG